MEIEQKSLEEYKNEFFKTQIKFNEKLRELLPSVEVLIEHNEEEILEVFSFFNFDINRFWDNKSLWILGRREKPVNYERLSIEQQLMVQLNLKNQNCSLCDEDEFSYLFLINKFNEELVLISKLEILSDAMAKNKSIGKIWNVSSFVHDKILINHINKNIKIPKNTCQNI